MMKYCFRSFLGCPLFSEPVPFLRTVNNGCTIETQDPALIRQLQENENDRNSEVIDWFLFKPGKTILIDNYGNQYGCTMNNNGHVITLCKLIE